MENSYKEEGDLSSDYEGFETEDDCTSSDSENDPSFELLEDTRSRLSKISLKKTRPRVGKTDVGSDEDDDDVRNVKVPCLNAKDAKSFEEIEKKIRDGQLDKLKVDQCKIYLRKHRLRLTGNKDVLLGRIREHLEVIDGGGEQKYPASSFVLNCQGDACTGDIVMFEQKVYEMFSIASRSATGPPCGTRTIAGRIVKESYGAAKQQHTFTIEVLWSKGEKPFSPLHPLLIKGRNLYRLKTLRQKWANEDDRRRVLQEKHDRGFVARTSREMRIQKKEMRKNHMRHGKNNIENMPPMISRPPQGIQLQNQQPHISQARTCLPQIPSSHHHNNNQAKSSQEYKCQVLANGSTSTQIVKPMAAPSQQHNHASTKQWETALHNTINTSSSHTVLPPIQNHADFAMPAQSTDKFHDKQVLRDSDNIRRAWTGHFSKNQTYASGYGYRDMHDFGIPGFPHNSQSIKNRNPLHNTMMPPQRQSVRREICHYYRQGRCHFMENCKFLHE